MKLQLRVDPGNRRILGVKFKTYGCGSAIASSSMFVDMLQGITLDEALEEEFAVGFIKGTEKIK